MGRCGGRVDGEDVVHPEVLDERGQVFEREATAGEVLALWVMCIKGLVKMRENDRGSEER